MVAVIAFRIGSVLLALVSLGFGIPGLLGIAHRARTGQLYRVMGFPAYDELGFQLIGIQVNAMALMVAFVVSCALGVVVAVLLWMPTLAIRAAIASVVILIFQAVFWVGFRLPYGPPLGMAAAIALVVGMIAARR